MLFFVKFLLTYLVKISSKCYLRYPSLRWQWRQRYSQVVFRYVTCCDYMKQIFVLIQFIWIAWRSNVECQRLAGYPLQSLTSVGMTRTGGYMRMVVIPSERSERGISNF